MFDHNVITAKDRYAKLENERNAYTDRAEKCAKYTIPMAFPKKTDNSNTTYETPYQSIGARGVNNMVSKLMLALFPPNAPFFRLSLGDEVLNALGDDINTIQQYEEQLSKLERRIVAYMETHQVRTTVWEALIQLIIAGNVLIFLPPAEGGMRIYRLNSYVVSRDGIGTVKEIVAKETLTYGSLPLELQSKMNTEGKEDEAVDIYTHTYLEGDTYLSYQEIEGEIIAGSEQTYPKDACPWIALRLKKMDG